MDRELISDKLIIIVACIIVLQYYIDYTNNDSTQGLKGIFNSFLP